MKTNFIDFDVLAVGPIAPEISASFDLFWNSREAYPGEALLQNFKGHDLLNELREEIQQLLAENEALLVEFQTHHQDWNNYLQDLPRTLFTGTARVIYDEPLVGEDTPPVQLIESIGELALDARQEILVSTPYNIWIVPLLTPLKTILSRIPIGLVLTILIGSVCLSLVLDFYL
ncbi:MAG: hypothetical protein KJP23_03210 [Deltaproteobacteria bacterium]|nr:hypothetical protein [Deltaproteobacteria bacterium]